MLRSEEVHSCLYYTASWFGWPLGQGDDSDEKKMVFLVESTHKGITPDRQYLKWKLVNLYSKRDIRDNENKYSHVGLLPRNPKPLNQVPDLATRFLKGSSMS